MKTGMGGSIITVASMSSHITNRPQPHAPYNATKAAVLQLTKSTACEWAPHNIRVSTISPGYFDTAMNRKILAEQGEEGVKMRKFWEAQTPMGRLGTPHELKGVVVFLASSASTFVTGAEFLVDGGYTAWWTNHDPSCHPNLILLRPSTYTREFCTASSVPGPPLSFPFLSFPWWLCTLSPLLHQIISKPSIFLNTFVAYLCTIGGTVYMHWQLIMWECCTCSPRLLLLLLLFCALLSVFYARFMCSLA